MSSTSPSLASWLATTFHASGLRLSPQAAHLSLLDTSNVTRCVLRQRNSSTSTLLVLCSNWRCSFRSQLSMCFLRFEDSSSNSSCDSAIHKVNVFEEHVFEIWTHHFRSLHFTHVQGIFWFAPERENSKLGCISCISSLFRMTLATLRLHCNGTI